MTGLNSRSLENLKLFKEMFQMPCLTRVKFSKKKDFWFAKENAFCILTCYKIFRLIPLRNQ